MAFIGKPGPPAAVEATAAPNLEQRIEALLQVRLSRLKMPPDIKRLFLQRIRNNVRKTTSAWCYWVGFLIMVNSAFDLSIIPPKVFTITLVFGVILSGSFLASGLLCRRGALVRLAPLHLGLPCILTVACFGYTGLLAHDNAVLDHYLNKALLVVATSIMFVGLETTFNIVLVGLTLSMFAVFIAASPGYPAAAKIQSIFFDGSVLIALIYGRNVQTLVLSRMFLLNMRDELRNSEASARHAQLSSIAYTDTLTEIPNRRYFDEICASMSEKTKNLLPLSICMIDIDHFKMLNDKLGHLQGDRCLKLVAATIRGNLRGKSDIVARFGGEEFVLLLPGTNMNAAYEVAERVRAAVMELDHPNPGAPGGVVTASIGVAELARPPVILQPLLQNADHALYRAKIAGRNRVST